MKKIILIILSIFLFVGTIFASDTLDQKTYTFMINDLNYNMMCYSMPFGPGENGICTIYDSKNVELLKVNYFFSNTLHFGYLNENIPFFMNGDSLMIITNYFLAEEKNK